jgi:hypothetical protein
MEDIVVELVTAALKLAVAIGATPPALPSFF